jgi:hypothetical protein
MGAGWQKSLLSPDSGPGSIKWCTILVLCDLLVYGFTQVAKHQVVLCSLCVSEAVHFDRIPFLVVFAFDEAYILSDNSD